MSTTVVFLPPPTSPVLPVGLGTVISRILPSQFWIRTRSGVFYFESTWRHLKQVLGHGHPVPRQVWGRRRRTPRLREATTTRRQGRASRVGR